MTTATIPTTPEHTLDTPTLEAVRAELHRRIEAHRAAWLLEPSGTGLLLARELLLASEWVGGQIAEATLQAMRFTLTPEGRAALAAATEVAA
jgi:hypothetical protein